MTNSTCRIAATAALAVLLSTAAMAAESDWAPVVQALGRSGTEMPGGVYRVGFARSDLKVMLDGVQIKPSLALGSYMVMHKMGNSAVVMGDLVLLHEEVNPVMKKLVEGGLEISALHNHLLRSEPATMYMHYMGHGDPVKLATALKAALAESKTPLAAPAASPPPQIDLDVPALEQIIGAKGSNNGGVLGFSVPRAENITESGMALPPAMGTGIAMAFQPTGGGKAAITGDFVLLSKEVNPVLKTLRDNGIEVTALHHHMLDDQPRLFYMHFWANDDAQKLARGLKAALGKVNVKS
jgi:hypothetical protein